MPSNVAVSKLSASEVPLWLSIAIFIDVALHRLIMPRYAIDYVYVSPNSATVPWNFFKFNTGS